MSEGKVEPQKSPERSVELLRQWRDYWRAQNETGLATMAGDAAFHLGLALSTTERLRNALTAALPLAKVTAGMVDMPKGMTNASMVQRVRVAEEALAAAPEPPSPSPEKEEMPDIPGKMVLEVCPDCKPFGGYLPTYVRCLHGRSPSPSPELMEALERVERDFNQALRQWRMHMEMHDDAHSVEEMKHPEAEMYRHCLNGFSQFRAILAKHKE
jgi:hypothetical protein